MSFAPPARTVRASHFVATELTALRAENRGIALVLVLGFLVVLSGIILAFFSSVTAESSASTAYSDGASAVMLADSTVALAQAQIRDATRGQSASEPVLAWASQPGAIRTYTGKGKAESVYKLYSAEDMVVKASEFTPSSEAIPDDWNSPKNDDFYTDLNAPVKNVAGTLIYPVVDPLASNPTYDPQQASFVEGFSITKPPAYIASQAASTTNNPAPMPVKWLYLLEDGKLVAPKLGASGDVEIENADPKNPIVGRVAFWTDDETAKVNINTASEGVYWDVPRFYSLEDFGKNQGANVSVPSLALCQPAQKEFQRYPGHPATTSLSAVFGHESLLPIPTLIKAANAKQFDPYYDIAPRIVSGGSRSGTRPTKQDEIMPQENKITATNVDRLYASVDELIFSMKTPVNSSRVPNTAVAASTTPGKITTEVLQRTKFFTTASSSAPETTLYNTPRIAIWPIPSTLTNRTAYDKLAAFCSTIGGEAYYFTRNNHRSLTADFSGRNVPLYRYLQALTSREVPGFGGDFLGKYRDATGSDRDQILTFIYDYIRCTNLQERTPGSTPYTPIFEKPPSGKLVPEGAGEVMPIQIDDTRGFGRFYSISQAAVLFYGAKGASGSTTGMRAVFFLQFATPMQGLGAMRCNLKYRVKGLQNLEVKVNGIDWKPLGFKLEGDSNGTNFMDTMDLDTFHGRSVGGSEGPTQAMVGKPFADIDAGKSARKKYPFFTPQDVAIPANRKTFEFRAKPNESEVVVEILKADSTEVVQTINLFYPEGEFSVPKVPGGGTAHSFGSRNLGDTPRLIDGADTVVSLEVAGAPGFESTAGDTRMIQALKNVPSPKFREHGDYRQKGVQFAHGLVMSVGEPFAGSKGGTLVTVPGEPNWMANGTQYKQLNSYISRRPDVPSRVRPDAARKDGGVMRKDGGPGDWDTGFGDQKDGAYINKPDEGDTVFDDPQNGQTRIPYLLGYGQGFAAATKAYFSPNRQIPSPLMFGSLPAGVQRHRPWETLLFHPRPEDTKHPGKKTPHDHLLADLFWMPVIEPYAISQPFATSGKINMNYQIQPFTYIRRDTGIRAVMKSTKFAALQPADASNYKPIDPGNDKVRIKDRRNAIHLPKVGIPETLGAFEDKFAKNELFKSASEICEIDLVPEGQTRAGMVAFWKLHGLTGDNLREKPYVDLYPRLTTKSNSYMVHLRVQTLKKASGTPHDRWIPGRDRIASEYRGSSLVERYIDVNDPRLPDFASVAAANPKDAKLGIDQYYKMRIVQTKRFAP